jgi:hypothetical protein
VICLVNQGEAKKKKKGIFATSGQFEVGRMLWATDTEKAEGA